MSLENFNDLTLPGLVEGVMMFIFVVYQAISRLSTKLHWNIFNNNTTLTRRDFLAYRIENMYWWSKYHPDFLATVDTHRLHSLFDEYKRLGGNGDIEEKKSFIVKQIHKREEKYFDVDDSSITK